MAVAAWMCTSESEFTDHAPVRVFAGTWNVAGKSPSESISSWLRDNMGSAGDLPEIYVVGCVHVAHVARGVRQARRMEAMELQCGARPSADLLWALVPSVWHPCVARSCFAERPLSCFVDPGCKKWWS